MHRRIVMSLGEPSGSPETPPLVRFADGHSVSDQKNSPSRFRFRPPSPLTFPFRVLPSDPASSYLRSVLGASRTLTRTPNGSRGRKAPCPQIARFSFSNSEPANLPV